jgi:FtsZ-binding cell division protein ZapB
MSDSNTEPHVSGQELRAALATSGRSRPNPLLPDAPPAWEWTTDEQAEVTELRESTAALAAEVDELRGAVSAAKTREHDLREALLRLSAARPWQRRALVAELAGRGLL